MDLLAEFGGEYTFQEKPKKLETSYPVCSFCLQAVDKQLCLEQDQNEIVFFRSKHLNETFFSHQSCFQEFAGGTSKHKLILLGDISLVEYVLGDDGPWMETYNGSRGPPKDAFVEIGFYHPISNKPMLEIIRKFTLQPGEQHSCEGKFTFADGYLGQPNYVLLPFESYRVHFKISILDIDELQNKHATSAVITCKKIRVLPIGQCFILKITGKKAAYRIAARTVSSESHGRSTEAGNLIALE